MRMRPTRKATVQTYSLSAPVGGLNARDSVADMPEKDAFVMDNWFPGTTSVATRNGCVNWATGLPAWVESLMAYRSPSAQKLFGVSNGSVYDVTSSGAVGAAVVNSLSSSRWQSVNFGTPGGQFLVCANGLDNILEYDGSTWKSITGVSTPAITGIDTSLLKDVNVHKNRLWFIEKNSFRVWYLPTSSIAGAAQSIDFSPLFKRGGSLSNMVTWTIDNTNGIQDYAAFITSEGEVALYQGSDPANASTWFLVGMFRVGRPIGQRCHMKVGSDVVLITADGFYPLSKALLNDRSQSSDAISYKIVNLVNRDVQLYNANFGWQPILHPMGNKLIINVPQVENNVIYQYVMNTITGAWCRFTGWNAACWELLGDNLYFGGNGVVAHADTGSNDNGANIVASVTPAFSYFGARGRNKRFTMAREIFQADGAISAATFLNTDFQTTIPNQTPSFGGSSGPPWNTTAWNSAQWGGANVIRKDWQTVNGIGFAASLTMQVVTHDFPISWLATDFVYELGGIL